MANEKKKTGNFWKVYNTGLKCCYQIEIHSNVFMLRYGILRILNEDSDYDIRLTAKTVKHNDIVMIWGLI